MYSTSNYVPRCGIVVFISNIALPSGYWLFSETINHFSSKRKLLGNKQNLHGWRDSHNLDRSLLTTQRKKYDLDVFESCYTREVLYEISDYSNLADHPVNYFFFMISRNWKPLDNKIMLKSHLNVWLVESTKLKQNSSYAPGIITKILGTQLSVVLIEILCMETELFS